MVGSRESRADGVRIGTNNAAPDADADAAAGLVSLSFSDGGSMQLFVPDDDDVIERFRLRPEDSLSRVCGWMFTCRRVGMRGRLHSHHSMVEGGRHERQRRRARREKNEEKLRTLFLPAKLSPKPDDVNPVLMDSYVDFDVEPLDKLSRFSSPEMVVSKSFNAVFWLFPRGCFMVCE